MSTRRGLSSKRGLQTLTLCALTGAALGAWSSPARAQNAPGFTLNRFEPSETGSEWFANDTLDLRGNLRPALGVVGDYGYKPYVLLNPDGSENRSIVSDQFFVHVGGSLVLFDRLRLGLSLPIALAQEGSAQGGLVNGQRVVSGLGAGVGDLRAALDLRLLGQYGDAFTLVVGGRVWVPTGSTTDFLGDGQVRIGPHLSAAGDVGIFEYAGTLGVIYRANQDGFAGHPTGSEVSFALATGVRVLDKKLLVGPEVYGSTVLAPESAILGDHTTPLGILGSAHYTAGDFRFGLGAGPGLSHAAGTAQFRGLASIEWAPGVAPEQAPPPPPSDRDGDGIIDSEDACPDVPGVRTSDAKTNGCPPAPPPPDRDGDGIIDSEDACPDTPGVRTDDPKTNGCPSDRDKDGIVDTEDACPDVPGVRTSDPKTNGCPPDLDRDKDGIPNDVDACPDEPGPKSDDPKTSGCPRVFIKNAQIQILEQPKFAFDKAIIKPDSDSLLGEVANVMNAHAEIARVRVEGHTDNVGSAAYNKALSERRAEAVVKWLSDHGVDKGRLSAKGIGKDQPIAPNTTDAGRALNRRVEFHIEQQDTTSKELVTTPSGGTVAAPPATKPIPPGAAPTPKSQLPPKP